MQTVQPLSARPAQSAPQTDKGEQATSASDLSSFRSTMEKAERKATAPEEPKQGGEAVSIPEAGMEAGNALALATMPEAAALQGEGDTEVVHAREKRFAA
ncbi:MAG: hypothetical protein EOM66_01260, partial [Clostridia bacterium]|nr:hypothetical protein [Clostridia bacterium]